jgi:hypothetical protein
MVFNRYNILLVEETPSVVALYVDFRFRIFTIPTVGKIVFRYYRDPPFSTFDLFEQYISWKITRHFIYPVL